MHALTFSRFGPPDVLEWTLMPEPQAEPGVAVVRTRAIDPKLAQLVALMKARP